MTDIISVSAEMVGSMTQVKLKAKHPMHDGLSKDEVSGELIPAMFLQEITVVHGEKVVFIANLSGRVAKDPFLGFSFYGATSGDELLINWVESGGRAGSERALIK